MIVPNSSSNSDSSSQLCFAFARHQVELGALGSLVVKKDGGRDYERGMCR